MHKTQTPIQFDCSTILYPRGEKYFLPPRMSPSNYVAQYTRSDTPTLMGRVNLNLLYLHRVVLVEELDHTYARAVDFD